MSRITSTFSSLKERGEKALIPFVTVGDPDLEATADLVFEMEEQGANLIELGIPFSDPLADGPIIQKASQRALRQRISLRKAVEFVSQLRQRTEIPLIFLTYFNPIFQYGEEAFVKDAVEAGVDGVIIPDLPPEEAGSLIEESEKRGFDTIFLLAPTSTEERITLISRVSRGFLYYVSLTGVTGVRDQLRSDIAEKLGEIRRISEKPLAVGFGVSTPEQARLIASWADGVAVGSAVVRVIEEHLGSRDLVKHVGTFVKQLKEGVNQSRAN